MWQPVKVKEGKLESVITTKHKSSKIEIILFRFYEANKAVRVCLTEENNTGVSELRGGS